MEHPVTREFRATLLSRIEDVKNEVLTWSSDTLQTRQGYIHAFTDILEFFSKENT
jgi:hypothetical protein